MAAKRQYSKRKAADNATDNVDSSQEFMYVDEISSLMHSFGDAKKPESKSVKSLHGILDAQMALLIRNAESVMKQRNMKKISHEDILFQMRKNKALLKRLLQFLSIEDARKKFKNLDSSSKKAVIPVEEEQRASQCLEYLAFIEKFTGDLTTLLKNEDIVDYVYKKQLKTRYLMAESMTQKEYLKFHEHTLRVSLCGENFSQFRKWLQQCTGSKFVITPLALSIVHFLARETIAMIVLKALEIKSRKFEKRDNNPYEEFVHSVDWWYELKNGCNLTGSKKMSVNIQNLPVHHFPNDPLTVVEIQAAFIHYQHPSPKPCLQKTGFAPLPRKVNLVCLADRDDDQIL